MYTANELATFLEAVKSLVFSVGRELASLYEGYQKTCQIDIQKKADHSPVTTADLVSHQRLLEGLSALIPQLPIVSEEAAPAVLPAHRAYWLVDPLDGTREFIAGRGEFTINVALIVDGKSVLGVLHVPCTQTTYFAYEGRGAYKQLAQGELQRLQTRQCMDARLTVTASRYHGTNKLQGFLAKVGEHKMITAGSALKFCLVAEGVADVYPRLGKTAAWDTAAGQCILEQAGGKVFMAENLQPLAYQAGRDIINANFIAVGDVNYNWAGILK